MSGVKTAVSLILIVLFFAVLVQNFITQRSAKDPNVIVFWHGIEGADKNRLFQQLIDEFNASVDGYSVKLQNYGAADQVGAKIMTAVAGNTQPDIIWWAPQQFGELAKSGVLMELDSLIENDTSFDRNDIYEGLWEASTINGHVYSLPFETNCLAMLYNKDLFAQAGVSIPEDWDEFRQACRTLTKDNDGDGKNDVYGFLVPLGKNEWTVWTWQCFLWQAGGEFYDPAENRACFATDAGAEAITLWNDLKNEDLAIFSESDAGYKLSEFLSGRIAMMVNGAWNYGALKDQDKVNYGAFHMPGKKRRATNIGGESIAFFAAAESKKDRLWQFAKFLMSPRFQTRWSMNTGYLPVSKSSAASDEYNKFLDENPFMKIFVEGMEYGKSRPAVAEYNRMSSVTGVALEKAMYGKGDPGTLLKEAQDAINSEVLK